MLRPKKPRFPSVPKHASTMNPEATLFTTAVNLSGSGKTILLQTVGAVAFNPSNPQKRESLCYFRYRKPEVIYYRENESKSFRRTFLS